MRRRHVLTGSYHNYFRIFAVDGSGDIVLQADKSAFKAKKMGGPLPGNKAGAKNGVRPGGLRENMAQDTLDFNKKILHSSWHPREDTIAVSSVRASGLVPTLTMRADRGDEQFVLVQCRVKAALYAYPTCPACTYLLMIHARRPIIRLRTPTRRLSSPAEPRLTHRDTETRIYRHQTDCHPPARRIVCPAHLPAALLSFPLFSAHFNGSPRTSSQCHHIRVS